MTPPTVFISTFRVVDGGRPAFETAFAEAVELIGSTKPGTALYAAYLDPAGSTVAVAHAFPDAPALAAHFVGSDDRSRSIAGLVTPMGFDLYGRAPTAALEQLRRESAGAGVPFRAFTDPIGGFLRAPLDE